jgi:DNA-binding PadR family transcriptional regulator
MLSKELTAASTRPLVLSLLSRGESYGYELIQRVKAVSGGEVEWTVGMLYPVLHRMEEEGVIQAEWKVSETGRRRKYYRLTPSGRGALRAEQARWNSVNQTLQSLWNPVLN